MTDDLVLKYIDEHQHETVYPRGHQENPYTLAEFGNLYDENGDNKDWHGGWVQYADGTLHYINESGENTYTLDANGCEIGSGCGSGCGSESGSGSDNGNGSGSGSGDECNVSPGVAYVGICSTILEGLTPVDIQYRIEVSWGIGTAKLNGTAPISGSVIGYYTANEGFIQLPLGNASCSWIGNYVATIAYDGESVEFGIPEIYYETE